MLDWNDESNDDADNSDNTDDDDDNDKPSGDGFDGTSSHPPPESDPRDRFDPQYYGGGDYGGGGSSSSGSGPDLLPDSFFRFQLSPGSDEVDLRKQLQGDQQSIQKRQSSSRVSEEEEESCSESDSIEKCAIRGEDVPTTRDDQTSLAGDALSGRLVGGPKLPSQSLVARGVCLGKDGVGLTPDATTRLPVLLDAQTDPAGRNTKNSPAESSVQHRTEEPRVPTTNVSRHHANDHPDPAALIAPTIPTQTSSASTHILDALQHFTPQSFLSVRLLGAGGFSTVDEVLHRETKLRLGRKTLKNRNPTAIEELKKEVSVLQKLRHPHVIRFLGAYSKGDKMSILVSPVAETTLALWLEQATAQQPANLVNTISKMFGCLVSSVRYLHEQRPVVKHMDIKPQNILVAHGDQEFPHVVLCDFGISSSDDLNDGQHKPLTRRYVAPEVFDGLARKQAADVWSLGCVFAEMASAPFSLSNSKWSTFRREYSGRTGKHYWQDVPSLQGQLSTFLDEAATQTEQQVVGTLKEMLSADPDERPSATLLSLKFTPAPCCLTWPNDKAIFPAPDQELEAVQMLVHKNSVDCCDRLGNIGVNSGQSHDVFKNAISWIEECSHAHEACRPLAATNKTLPTRLLDTHPEGLDDSFVRIVDSASIIRGTEAVKYVTLSHVWSETSAKLTTDGVRNAKLGLQRQGLSSALESGIQAAQNLGFRYIWTDSLCIIQDSEADKHAECAKMASVFRNAALTIVLDQINEDRPAIIETPSSLVLSDVNANMQSEIVKKTAARTSAASSLPVSDFVTPGFGWDTRAWALQERLLCSRLLHLCEKQLYWECASLKASDTFPRGLASLVWEKAHSKSHHDRPQRGKSGSKSVTVKNTQDKLPVLEATRLRKCQWIHKEGTVSGDCMDVAHTTVQPGNAKAPLSSKGISAPKYARKNPAAIAAPSISSTVSAVHSQNDSIGSFNASVPWTGTTATEQSSSFGRPTSPFLKGLFGLSSLADTQTRCTKSSTAIQNLGTAHCNCTAAHLSLSKVYRGSEPQASGPTPSCHLKISAKASHDHLRTARSNDNAAPDCTSTCVGTNAAPFYDPGVHVDSQVNRVEKAVKVKSTQHPLSDQLANTLAHQLESGVRSHPCVGDEVMREEDGTKV